MSRDRLTVNRGDVSTETYTEGRGPAVVVLPSYGRDGGDDFDVFSARLAGAGYRVLRPQPRGIGRSFGPLQDVTIEQLADDVAMVVSEVSKAPVVMVGHAFGNFVARTLATNHPELVAKVVLAAASGPTVDPKVNSAPFRAGDPTLPRADRLAALRLAFFAPGHDPSSWLNGWYPDTLKMQRLSVSGIDLSRYWGAGEAPILEVIAEHDPFHQRAEWDDLQSRYGDRVETVVIADASHALFPEQPDAVADAVIASLQKSDI